MPRKRGSQRNSESTWHFGTAYCDSRELRAKPPLYAVDVRAASAAFTRSGVNGTVRMRAWPRRRSDVQLELLGTYAPQCLWLKSVKNCKDLSDEWLE